MFQMWATSADACVFYINALCTLIASVVLDVVLGGDETQVMASHHFSKSVLCVSCSVAGWSISTDQKNGTA